MRVRSEDYATAVKRVVLPARRGHDNTRATRGWVPGRATRKCPRVRLVSSYWRVRGEDEGDLDGLTWKTFLKKGLLAESITLCAVRHCPSLARVTSTRPSSSHRLSKLVAILLRKLFHFRHI